MTNRRPITYHHRPVTHHAFLARYHFFQRRHVIRLLFGILVHCWMSSMVASLFVFPKEQPAIRQSSIMKHSAFVHSASFFDPDFRFSSGKRRSYYYSRTLLRAHYDDDAVNTDMDLSSVNDGVSRMPPLSTNNVNTEFESNENGFQSKDNDDNTFRASADADKIEAGGDNRPNITNTPTSSPLAHIPSHLIPTLDLIPLMTHVSTFACTKRGKDAILSLVKLPSSSPSKIASMFEGNTHSSGRKQQRFFGNRAQTLERYWMRHSDNARFAPKYSASKKKNGRSNNDDDGLQSVAPIAQSASGATLEYEIVRQAMGVLQSQQHSRNGTNTNRDGNGDGRTIPLPPMFGLRDRVSDLDSDDDEWLDLCLSPLPMGVDMTEEIDLEAILKAEQVVKFLLETYQWAMDNSVNEQALGLANIIRGMECIDEEVAGDGDAYMEAGANTNESNTAKTGNITPLSDLYNELKGAVEIVRAGPSIRDVNNQISYQFQLTSENGRFEELELLRKKEQQVLERGKGKNNELDNQNQRQLVVIREEISSMEHHITRKLINAMIRAAPAVQHGMNVVARLDVVFSRAAFGCEWNGQLPTVGNEGRIDVDGFVHPVLALEKNIEDKNEAMPKTMGGIKTVVPVDLKMPGMGEYQALIISGPNAGGKTLALKSFGLAAILVKLGLPIPVSQKFSVKSSIVVDYFDDVTVEVGDNQSVVSGESTLMARLNACSSLIERIAAADSMIGVTKLVLLDELGGGTDPVAGASIAQAILEKLISTDTMCKIVATTHSPQLKVLSLNDVRFQCASVLLSSEDEDGVQKKTMQTNNNGGKSVATKYLQPTYQLRYGTTGESYALGAASRCRPSLPDDVIRRAAELMSGGENDQAGETLRKHLSALERERSAAISLTEKSEMVWKDIVGTMQASETNLARIECRLESIFETLKRDETRSAYELVGDSLGDLRLLKKKVKTEKELLADKGLRKVSETHSFYDGDTVVIIAEGEWEGCDAVVKISGEESDPLTVTVVPTLDWRSSPVDNEGLPPLLLKRTEIAVWNYPDFSWGFTDEKNPGSGSFSKRKQPHSTKKVLDILSTLNTESRSSKIKSKANEDMSSNSFTSSRQRKAAVAQEKSAKKKPKKGKKK